MTAANHRIGESDARAERRGERLWHVLDVNSIWIKEFAAALFRRAPVLGWIREMSWAGVFKRDITDGVLTEPYLPTRHFHLQRGYSRFPLSSFLQPSPPASAMIGHKARADKPSLICTTPYYAPRAEQWPGPVIYYLTDLTKAYTGAHAAQIVDLDQRMCAAAVLVCPNSQRIADYLHGEAKCPLSKLLIVPNATRQENILAAPLYRSSPPPPDIAHLPRPIVGIIGNLAGNLDWLLIREAVKQNQAVSWVFVGPVTGKVPNREHRTARQHLLTLGANVAFTGPKPYAMLRDYARCFDAAFLPYCPRTEPTYSGSSTRFYEHLAACRPIIATRGFEELLRKEPLLELIDDARQMTGLLERLREMSFTDGHEELRWRASLTNTWDHRAGAIYNAVVERIA